MVFVSHIFDPDHIYAEKIATILNENGVHCWIAPECVKEHFVYDVPHAINTCEIFLLLLTKNTAKSDQVMKELLLAENHHKKIIPLILVDEGDFQLSDSYIYQLDMQRYEFSFDNQDHLNWLIEKCKLGEPVLEMDVNSEEQKKITLMKGDFQENMDLVIKNYPEKLNHIAFVVGIDSSSRLSVSSKKGILRWVCQYLDNEYGIDVGQLQKLINEAKINQLGHINGDVSMNYKDSILITVPLPSDEEEGKPLKLHLLLIANSRKKTTYYETYDVDDVEGIDSREVIMSIFNKFQTLDPEIHDLFIGAMGTNGLNFPYEVCVSEIFNCYLYAQRMKYRPYSIWFSTRQADMERSGLSSDEIISYISTVIHFLRE